MPQKDPNRNWQKDYDASDLKHVFDTSAVHSWNDAIKYLDRKGMNDNELTPGEVMHMKQDFEQLTKDHVAFTQDPQQAYKLAKQHRSGGKAGSAQSKKR